MNMICKVIIDKGLAGRKHIHFVCGRGAKLNSLIGAPHVISSLSPFEMYGPRKVTSSGKYIHSYQPVKIGPSVHQNGICKTHTHKKKWCGSIIDCIKMQLLSSLLVKGTSSLLHHRLLQTHPSHLRMQAEVVMVLGT